MNRIFGTTVRVEISREMDELVSRRLKLRQEQLDEFWIDSISSVIPLILDAFEVRAPPEMESEGIRVLLGYAAASTDPEQLAMKPVKPQPPELLAHLPSAS